MFALSGFSFHRSPSFPSRFWIVTFAITTAVSASIVSISGGGRDSFRAHDIILESDSSLTPIASANPETAKNQDKIDFNQDVRPILSENCFACHGPDGSHRKGDLRLDTLEGATAKRENGEHAVVPSHPEKSLLIKRISSDDPEFRMPPIEAKKNLTKKQIAILAQWIAEGAEWDSHWAFTAPKRSPLPEVKDPLWSQSPIDAFIYDKLQQKGLKPSPEAGREEIIRRVTLDLIGILPTPKEIQDFLDDKSADAYEKVVDRLLASQAYGEHRARYWMDYARYGDSSGLHTDVFQSRWPYRDYVINAFNADMPYDQFTREQLAGDLIFPENVDQLVATGMVRCNISTGESGSIIEELRNSTKVERSEMYGAVYLGLTTGCSACHDHKYDPLTQKDFYELTAFFNNIREKASNDDRADWPPSIYVPTPANKPAYNTLLAKKSDIEKQLAERRKDSTQLIAEWIETGGPQAVATDALELHLRLDENDHQDDANASTIHNSASGANPKKFTITGPAPLWAEETLLWPTFRLETNTKVDLGQLGNVDKTDAFTWGGWVRPRNVPGGSNWNGDGGTLVGKVKASDDQRGWQIYYIGSGVLQIRLVSKWPNDALVVQSVGTTEYTNPFYPAEGHHGPANYNLKLAAPRGMWHHVSFTYDGSGKADGVKLYMDGHRQETSVVKDTLQGSILNDAPMTLGRSFDATPLQATAYQDVRFYKRALAEEEIARLGREDLAAEIARLKKPDQWSIDERKIVHDTFFEEHDPASADLLAQIPAIDAELYRLSGGGSITLICREKESLAYASVLSRGGYAARSERVLANTPSFLPPMAKDLPHNRAGLAEWTLSQENPLTTRVTVNRIWQEIFGTGIVETADDFGTVGSPPSHQQLLDWLAVDFRESGWKIKRLYKMLLMSAAYRQTAHASAELALKDDGNILLSRGPRFRMDAEMLRDSALSASGLLVRQIGGPSVRPYQPTGVWEAGGYGGGDNNYVQNHGANLYRRSLYTYIKRMAPMPNMEAFDATDHAQTCISRQRTNTPLAALVLMNDPQFLEAARVLAARVIQKGGKTDAARLDYLGKLVLSRPFDEKRSQMMLTALATYRDLLKESPRKALELISIGESPNPLAPQAPERPSITTGKPASSSVTTIPNSAALANDGLSDSTAKFWEADASKTHGAPTWWQVDLEKPTTVGSVVVVCYYGDARYYGFTVETSLDGQTWKMVADRRENTQPSTAAGYECNFPAEQARYIRIDQTHNSANLGRHIVEVKAYEKPLPSEDVHQGAVEHAAWMMMANTILNSDNAINK